MIPTNPKALKQALAEADRNIERGDWPDEFGLADEDVPKPPPSGAAELLEVVGKKRVPSKK